MNSMSATPGHNGLPGADPNYNQAQYAASDSNDSRSPLERFGFLKNLTDKKSTKDGQPAKRRGPKPDSKPALTRRQELNRQAQRTHRERKEMYIKCLEQEVLRLKEVFGSTSRERDSLAEENRKLRELLAQHGIAYDPAKPGPPTLMHTDSTFGGSGSLSPTMSSNYNPVSASSSLTSPPSMPGRAPPGVPGPDAMQLTQPAQGQPTANHGLDYDQIGIDFVLTLERPCMDHMQFLLVRAEDSTEDVSGHVLMATCPPHSHIQNKPEEKYPHKMPELPSSSLATLLDLSHRLPIDIGGGEITPIMAWSGIRSHPSVDVLSKADFDHLKDVLVAKIRCYGFGAVIEQFEVTDAVNNVVAQKAENYVV